MWPTSGSFLLLLVLDGFSLLFSEGKLETFLLSIHAPWIYNLPGVWGKYLSPGMPILFKCVYFEYLTRREETFV